LLALILGYKNISSFLAINWQSTFKLEKADHHLRVMTWNASSFLPIDPNTFRRSGNHDLEEMAKEISQYNPDIICFQEFFSSPMSGTENFQSFFQRKMGYPYCLIAKDNFDGPTYGGTAIFSRLPFIDTGRMKFPADLDVRRTAESLLWVDLLMNGTDTIRVTTLHLKSFNFRNRDYKNLRMISKQEDPGLVASKSIMRKMREAFSLRAQQADFVQPLLNNSPHPQIICGDFNDVPNSYTYFKMKNGRRDAFLEKGLGMGKTYTSNYSGLLRILPTIRIDYILTDRVFKVSQYKNNQKVISDHYAQVADVELPPKSD
jgi:endonuclease/exonuclease/phosphatase family metal-dependent hydrolase